MLCSYKYRIYPNIRQKILLERHFGAVRLVYNLALETSEFVYKQYKKRLSYYDLQGQLPNLKEGFPWLREINANSLQISIKNLDNAFSSFLRNKKGFPNYKSKNRTNSFQVPQGIKIDIERSKLHIPKFKNGISISLSRKFSGLVKSVTISKTSTGKFFASILVDTREAEPQKPKLKPQNVIGVDLGIKDFAVTSEGEVIPNPKYLKRSLARLKVLQRRASKKVKGSANRRKAFLKVARIHEKVANQRKDFLHKLSTNLVNNHDGIAIEDLAVKNMVKNHKLAQAISDVSWSEFRRQLEYKCRWYGKHLLVIGRFEPSSKLCSKCRYKLKELTLKTRYWVCPKCKSFHHRDINAAVNIKKIALRTYYSRLVRPSVPAESRTVVRTLKQERQGVLFNPL